MSDVTAVVKRMFFLAWKSSRVVGMGALMDEGAKTEDEVWRHLLVCGDYPLHPVEPENGKNGSFRADYVFGRMMKMSVRVVDGEIELSGTELRPDYQSWCSDYPSYTSLHAAAKRSLATVEQEVATDE